jgi:DNA-directed RNA polymerase I, II, and III subunit RPABC2
MPAKTILKNPTASVEAQSVDETNIVLDNSFVSTEQNGGSEKDIKKTQIKKKEPITITTSASESIPPLKIIKKKVSITEQPDKSLQIAKPIENSKEKGEAREEDKGEARKEDKGEARKEDKGEARKEDKGEARKEDKGEARKEDKGEAREKEVLVDVSKALKTSKKPSKKQDNTDIFNDDDVDYRYIITNYDFSKNKTLPKITKYEKALLVGKRAKQIEEGANPNVKVLPGQTSIDIAEEELRQRKTPFIIKRPIGNKFEYWKPIDMEVIMD